MNGGSKQSRSHKGSGRGSNSSSYHLQRWGGETRREEPWKGGETKETHIDRAQTRINNFDKRWDQSRWRWNCCGCAFGNLSYTYDSACPMCGERRCANCLVHEIS
ncbi:hypothetical protein F5Y09DRAFT_334533 [Xylaria sp. FL1042]|nr:hypothetical protein F5Y09DRAFT_334533 [Xylaria sp. FL1042]